jgi:hypothetical protein
MQTLYDLLKLIVGFAVLSVVVGSVGWLVQRFRYQWLFNGAMLWGGGLGFFFAILLLEGGSSVAPAERVVLLVPILATWYIVARVYRDMDPNFFAKINARVAKGGAPTTGEAGAFGMTFFRGIKNTEEVRRAWWLGRFPPTKEKEDAQQAVAREARNREG